MRLLYSIALTFKSGLNNIIYAQRGIYPKSFQEILTKVGRIRELLTTGEIRWLLKINENIILCINIHSIMFEKNRHYIIM
jgi:hypothetical protein